ncbi:hypothetical protein [Rhizobium esperanzae]|uniref:Uncharacterized protein n=1 Tax=Rhizobium esperanzae TaxID=1967781 RepID=A0A7W6W7A9_9HYPH|nr:hypothetical protein [Rhizobium esperanzae]MBB4238121.1 hypothetical protein [Rhizobium esperanzae]
MVKLLATAANLETSSPAGGTGTNRSSWTISAVPGAEAMRLYDFSVGAAE